MVSVAKREKPRRRADTLVEKEMATGPSSGRGPGRLVSRAPPLQEPDELIRHPVDRDVPRLDDLDEPMLLQKVDFEFEVVVFVPVVPESRFC